MFSSPVSIRLSSGTSRCCCRRCGRMPMSSLVDAQRRRRERGLDRIGQMIIQPRLDLAHELAEPQHHAKLIGLDAEEAGKTPQRNGRERNQRHCRGRRNFPAAKRRNLSWLRRRNSSRSGGRGPCCCGPEPQGPRGPELHGPPDWLLHGINSLLNAGEPAVRLPPVSGGYRGVPSPLQRKVTLRRFRGRNSQSRPVACAAMAGASRAARW